MGWWSNCFLSWCVQFFYSLVQRDDLLAPLWHGLIAPVSKPEGAILFLPTLNSSLILKLCIFFCVK